MVDQKIRDAASETRSVFSGRPHPPIGRLASRAAVRSFTAVTAGIIVVFATIGVVGWIAVGGSGDVAQAPETPPDLVTTPSHVTVPPTDTTADTTAPSSTVPGDDGRSDASAFPDGWLDDVPEDARFLLLDSGIAFIAFPESEAESDWWISIAQAPQIDGNHLFGPDDQGENLAGIPEVLILLAFDDGQSELVIAGIAPAQTDTVEITFGNAPPVTVDRVFQRSEVGRSVFVGSFPSELLLDQAPPLTVEMSAIGTDGQEIPTPAVGYQSSSVNEQYTGPITPDLFRIPPPLITDSITADTLPEVGSCQGGPDVDNPPPNQGREITDGEVAHSPQAALESLLSDELSDSWYPHGGYIEIALPDGTTAYAVPFNGDLEEGAVMLIRVGQHADGWTVTSWEASGC